MVKSLPHGNSDCVAEVNSLVDLCIEFLLKDETAFSQLVDPNSKVTLPNVLFSPLLSQRIFKYCKSSLNVDTLLPLFADAQKAPLSGFIDLSGSLVTDISPLSVQPVSDVNCSFCTNLTIDHILETFRRSTSTLAYLNLEDMKVENPYLKGEESLSSDCSHVNSNTSYDMDCWLGRFTKLKYLTVANTNLWYGYLSRDVLGYLTNLVHLDIGSMVVTDNLSVLKQLQNSLKSLSLYNIEPRNGPLVEQRFRTIFELKKLQVLDISCNASDGMVVTYGVDNLLLNLVGSLNELVSLDISGISLAEEPVKASWVFCSPHTRTVSPHNYWAQVRPGFPHLVTEVL